MTPTPFLKSIIAAMALGASVADAGAAQTTSKRPRTKADLIAALKDAFAYCDRAYDGMTDASGTQMVSFFGADTPKLSLLSFNLMHNTEHSGNLVTYMRLKNIVPPTSEPPPPHRRRNNAS